MRRYPHHYSDFELELDVTLEDSYTRDQDWVFKDMDDDVVDLDIDDHVEVDQLLVSVNGDIDYNPGDDVSVEDILNNSLNGAGNDTGVVMNNSNQVSDDDTADNTTATNKAVYNQTARADGGKASSDDGISSGGLEAEGSMSASSSAWASHYGSWYGHSGHAGISTDLEGNLDLEDLGDGNFNTRAGDDAIVEGVSAAEANASNDTAAFTNTLVQGENILNNSIDLTVVGGSMETISTGEDLGSIG